MGGEGGGCEHGLEPVKQGGVGGVGGESGESGEGGGGWVDWSL